MRFSKGLAAALALVATLAASPAFGQTDQGRIAGTVRD